MHTDTFSFEVENEGEVYKVDAKEHTHTSILGDKCAKWYKLLIIGNGKGDWVSFVPCSVGYKFSETKIPMNDCIKALEQKISNKIISRNE